VKHFPPHEEPLPHQEYCVIKRMANCEKGFKLIRTEKYLFMLSLYYHHVLTLSFISLNKNNVN